MFKHSLTAGEDGLLMNILSRELPLLPARAVREALKKKDIKVNGVRAGENVAVLQGDKIDLFTPVAMREIPVLYEDEDCLIVNKPSGLNTDNNLRSSFSLLSWAKERAGEDERMALVHRLDNQTGGLVVLAKNPAAEEALKDMFKGRQLLKQYECLVIGEMPKKTAVEKAYLIKDNEKGRVRVYADEVPQSREIVTEYTVLKPGAVSRLSVTLHTGRTHQIRAHLAFLGHPVLGDEVYGQRDFNRKYKAGELKLCATTLAFYKDCPVPGLRGKRFSVEPLF